MLACDREFYGGFDAFLWMRPLGRDFEGLAQSAFCLVTFPLWRTHGGSWAESTTVLCGSQPCCSAQLISSGAGWGTPVVRMQGIVTIFPPCLNMCCSVLTFTLFPFVWYEVNRSQMSSVEFLDVPYDGSMKSLCGTVIVLLGYLQCSVVQTVEAWLRLCFFCLCQQTWAFMEAHFDLHRAQLHFPYPSRVWWLLIIHLFPPTWSTGDTSSNYTYRIEIQSHGPSSRNRKSSVTRALLTDEPCNLL